MSAGEGEFRAGDWMPIEMLLGFVAARGGYLGPDAIEEAMVRVTAPGEKPSKFQHLFRERILDTRGR